MFSVSLHTHSLTSSAALLTPSLLQQLTYSKMHGLGNDFIMVDAMHLPNDVQAYLRTEEAMSALSQKVCHRNFGIGADGCILVSQLPDEAYPFYLYYNQDGTSGGMCGNGIRCFAQYVMQAGYLPESHAATFDKAVPYTWSCHTPVGPKGLTHLQNDLGERTGFIKVNMGVPVLTMSEVPFNTECYQVTPQPHIASNAYSIPLPETVTQQCEGVSSLILQCVSMGNPHGVVWHHLLPEVLQPHWEMLLQCLGPHLEVHPAFPKKANISFARKHNDHHVTLAVWERGCGPTLACGTGACATVVSGISQGILSEQVIVALPGGKLDIQWQPRSGDASVWMTGTATLVGRIHFDDSFWCAL
jgi:diaminopimelate epimerase